MSPLKIELLDGNWPQAFCSGTGRIVDTRGGRVKLLLEGSDVKFDIFTIIGTRDGGVINDATEKTILKDRNDYYTLGSFSSIVDVSMKIIPFKTRRSRGRRG